MKRSHKVIFFLIALLAFGTFAFGILQLIGARQTKGSVSPSDSNLTTNR